MPINNSDNFLITEQKIINLLLNDKRVVDDLLNNKIIPDHFSDRHQFLIKCIFQEYLDSNSSFPRLLTRSSYEHYLKGKFGNSGEVLTHLKTYDTCVLKAVAESDDIGTLKIELINGYSMRCSQRAFEQYEKNLSIKGSYISTQELAEKLNEITTISSSRKSTFTTIVESKEEYLQYKKEQRENPSKIIKTGIDEFDAAMVGGMAPQTLTLIVADAGTGKTSCMLNIGLGVAKCGHNVLFVSLEMSRFRLIDRIVSNISGIHFGKICQPEEMNEQEYEEFQKSFDYWNDIKGNFAILDSVDRVSVSSLKREIELHSMVYKPEVVIVDYIGIVKPEARYKDRNDIELGEISKELRFLGKKYDFGVLSACQLNREAIRRMKKTKETLAGSEDLRGSGELGNDADFIFALFPTEEGNRLKGQTIKSRYGKSHNTFHLAFDGARCRVGNYKLPNMLPQDMDADFADIFSSNVADETDDEFKINENNLDDLDFESDIG